MLLSSLTHVQNIAVWLVVLVCTIIYTILLPQIIYDFSMVRTNSNFEINSSNSNFQTFCLWLLRIFLTLRMLRLCWLFLLLI